MQFINVNIIDSSNRLHISLHLKIIFKIDPTLNFFRKVER